MPCWLFTVYMNEVMKGEKTGMRRMRMRFQKIGREWRLPGLLYVDDLVFCDESEENLKGMVGRFVEVCRRIGMNADKSKGVVLGG